jgi:hypothetical protein
MPGLKITILFAQMCYSELFNKQNWKKKENCMVPGQCSAERSEDLTKI